MQHIGHIIAQGTDVVVAVAALGFGDGVDLIVARVAGVGGDKDVAGNLQHLQFAGFIVEVQPHDHVGQTVIDGSVRLIFPLGGAVNAHQQNVEFLVGIGLGRIDQVADGDGAALRAKLIHDDGVGAADDQRDYRHGAKQNFPPQAPGLFLAPLTAAGGGISSAVFAAAGTPGRFAARAAGASGTAAAAAGGRAFHTDGAAAIAAGLSHLGMGGDGLFRRRSGGLNRCSGDGCSGRLGTVNGAAGGIGGTVNLPRRGSLGSRCLLCRVCGRLGRTAGLLHRAGGRLGRTADLLHRTGGRLGRTIDLLYRTGGRLCSLGRLAALTLGKFGVIMNIVGGTAALGPVQVQTPHLGIGSRDLLMGHPRKLLAAAQTGSLGIGAGAGAGLLHAGVGIGIRGAGTGMVAADIDLARLAHWLAPPDFLHGVVGFICVPPESGARRPMRPDFPGPPVCRRP